MKKLILTEDQSRFRLAEKANYSDNYSVHVCVCVCVLLSVCGRLILIVSLICHTATRMYHTESDRKQERHTLLSFFYDILA